MREVLITGSKSGLGKYIKDEFEKQTDFIIHGPSIMEMDVKKLEECKSYSKEVAAVDILINCAGLNLINPIEKVHGDEWDLVMNTNAKGILNTTKAFLPQLIDSAGTILNVVSNACRIPMTHSIAYNASKGAAEIMTKQMARELTKQYGIIVFGINPNKMEGTKMSEYIERVVPKMRGWTYQQAREYQLGALLTGEETKPEWIAELVVWLLSKQRRHKYLSGCLLDLGA